MISIRHIFVALSGLAAFSATLFSSSLPANARSDPEPPVFAAAIAAGTLAALAERLPTIPFISDLTALGRTPGHYGGTLNTLIRRNKDIRFMVVNGYARLVGYDAEYNLRPDILRAVDIDLDRRFTLHLRPGHRWSDGHPFTSEDFRYFWEDIANNSTLSPVGPPEILLLNGEAPQVEIIDEVTIRYSWSQPNPRFLSLLALPRPPFIYRPAHYLKQFHEKYTDPESLARQVASAQSRNWAALHNRKDSMYKFDNSDLPTLQPWINKTQSIRGRFIFERNPYFHRVDINGRQLPYIDRIIASTASVGLIPAKTIAGETDLQSYGLSFSDISILKSGEARGGYDLRLWPSSMASNFALYPNLTCNDPVWRALFRQAEFRHALSLAIDRNLINRTLFFGLGKPVDNAVLQNSPLYIADAPTKWARHDPEEANRLLDKLGLTKRGAGGVRLLPDGRPMTLIVETAGESTTQIDILQLIERNWRDIGVRLFIKPSQRDVMRTRAYFGASLMTVWTGWDNGIPAPSMDPSFLAPQHQDMLIWPAWGQYHQTGGQSGEPVDLPAAQKLNALYEEWIRSTNLVKRREAWRKMLEIHAEEQFIIGVVSEIPQPVIASKRLRNVPVEQTYGWQPMPHFAPAHMDHFWIVEAD